MEKKIEKIFTNLEDWRKLPKYQLERRLDIFFTIYLKEIVEVFYSQILDEKVVMYETIIPEFPLKKDGANSSTNVDYVMFCKDKLKCIFIELKTDIDSVDNEQIDYLINTKKNGWEETFNNVKKIKNHLEKTRQTKSLEKYDAIFRYFKSKGINILLENDMRIDVLYIHPIATKISRNNEVLFDSINFDFIIKRLSKEDDIISKSFKGILEEIYIESLEKNKKKRLENQYQTNYNVKI